MSQLNRTVFTKSNIDTEVIDDSVLLEVFALMLKPSRKGIIDQKLALGGAKFY
jgi:hypothetical protein